MMKHKSPFICSAALLLVLAGCAGKPNAATRTELGLLDTVITLTVYGDNPEDSLDRILERTAEIHASMTIYEDSPISALNEAAGQGPQPLPEDVYTLLSAAQQYAALTGGAFDMTVRPLTRLWGIGTDTARLPAQPEIDAALPLIDYTQLGLDDTTASATLPAGTAIDLGGIAKGYACDQAAEILLECGIPHALLDFGGTIYAQGSKPDGTLWRIGIRNPVPGGEGHIAVLSLRDKAVVTSGAYERYFMQDNILYHHIFDPQTGYPAQSGLLSVTIVSSNSTLADALSTACFVLGKDRGIELLGGMEDVEAVFVTEQQEIFITAGLQDVIAVSSDEYTLVAP